jgi:enoyl-CoA hydratase/carnithine racemase
MGTVDNRGAIFKLSMGETQQGRQHMTELITLAVADRVATVTLNRPPVNAFNADMFKTFKAILDDLAKRSDWGVLHIRSAGKVFSGGADLAEISTRFASPDKMDAAARTTRPFQELFQRISDLPQVSLAEIGGAAMGGGFELALGCDLRIAANEAKLGLPEVGLGLLPGGGGTQRLTWIAGPAVAARVILAADAIDGKTARDLGMVQWSAPRAELEAEAKKIAQRVASLHPLALAACKVCIRLARDPERNGFAAETEWTGRLLATDETQRRVADFLAGARR